MWNKIESQEVKELKAKVKDLNNQLSDAVVRNMNMSIEKPKPSVIVYLKDDKVLRVYDADEFIHADGDYIFIYRGDDFVASVKREEVIAISTNTISVDEPVYYYPHNGNTDRL